MHPGVLELMNDPARFRRSSAIYCGACGRDDGGCPTAAHPNPAPTSRWVLLQEMDGRTMSPRIVSGREPPLPADAAEAERRMCAHPGLRHIVGEALELERVGVEAEA
jgi:hypothetical protein